MKALHSKYGSNNPNKSSRQSQRPGQEQRTGWVWYCSRGNSNPSRQNWHGQGNCPQPPQPHLPPWNDDTIDTLVVYKATTEREKEEYCRTSQCFHCGKQGHLVHNCPSKPACTCTVQIEDSQSTTSGNTSPVSPQLSLTAQVACLTKKEHGASINEMHSLGEDMDFLGT